MNDTILIYNARLIDSNIDKKNSAILIKGKKIESFPDKATVKDFLADESILKIDAEGCAVMPSFIDTHAHFRDPGFTQKEDLVTGSMAACKGGYSTVVLMPNTNPVVSSYEMAEANNQRVRDAGYCKSIQAISITKDFEGVTANHLLEKSRKQPFNQVISEDGKEVANAAVMFEAMKIAAKKKFVVACHSEDTFLAAKARILRSKALQLTSTNLFETPAGGKKQAVSFLKEANILLAQAEDVATARNIRLAKDAGCHLHLCHVSTSYSVELAKQAKEQGIDVTFEITPHHISMNGEKANIFNIVNPPLRSEEDRLALIKALVDGDCDCIGTDHAPHTADDKKNGAPGFSGIETAFSTCYSVLVMENGMNVRQLSKLMSENPAKILGLKNEGILSEGYMANLVIVDLESQWRVKGEDFASRGKFTPLEGKKLYGCIKKTIFEGKIVYDKKS